jgi:excisionase family DNA binding protein
MAGNLYTVAEAADILKVRESWLRTKASARQIPCTFVGKHLRFSDDDLAEIMKAGSRQAVTSREPRSRRSTR